MSEHITDEILLQENASLKQAIMLCAKDFGIDPGDYLHDVLTRDAIGEIIDDEEKEHNHVWMDKDEATKLCDCRAALRDCVALLDESLGYVTTNWIRNRADYVAQIEAAITNARKALGEQ